MSERIYRIDHGGGEPQPLEEAPFSYEEEIQRLIADHPEVLAGEAMTPPRRWLLVGEEVPVFDADGSTRGSLDILLVDQDAHPTLVEVKRGSNRELRREVLGQMLDYVANAEYWSVEDLWERCEETHADREGGFESALAHLLGEDDPNPDDFWHDVGVNLHAAEMCLLFVADGIPDELARVVEFLNRQMATVEVLAVDLRRFADGDAATLVPRVIGRRDKAARASRPRRAVANLDEWLTAMPEGAVRDAARTLLERAEAAGGVIEPTYAAGGAGRLIRVRCAFRSTPVTVAWMHPPGEFRFGSPSNRAFPANVSAALADYVGEFEDDPFEKRGRTRGDPPRVSDWAIHPGDVAANVEVLASRVETVIRRLAAL